MELHIGEFIWLISVESILTEGCRGKSLRSSLPGSEVVPAAADGAIWSPIDLI